MTRTDPYAVLGVRRTATREEIARAYRRLAKQHHPDAGAAPSPQMGRINEAWGILSDPSRRARWDRDHTVVTPPAWSPFPTAPEVAKRPTAPIAPPSRWDSGWAVIGALLGAAVIIGAVTVAVFVTTAPPDDRGSFDGPDVTFRYPAGWAVRPGDGTDSPQHRVIAHLVSFTPAEDEWCTSFDEPCPLSGSAVPSGTASIVITAWEGGSPPEPQPVTRRPFGLDADAIIGGAPAVFEQRLFADGPGLEAWWQLSPPGFPDRWIEVRADIAGFALQTDDLIEDINQIMNSLEFTD